MAVRHVYTHLCEYAIVDKDGKTSFINIIQNIILDEFPGALISLFVGVGFTAAAGQSAKVSIEDPNGKPIFQTSEEVVPSATGGPFPRGFKHVNQVLLLLKPAVFPLEGTYNVVLRVDGKVIHREPFAVLKRNAPDGNDENADEN